MTHGTRRRTCTTFGVIKRPQMMFSRICTSSRGGQPLYARHDLRTAPVFKRNARLHRVTCFPQEEDFQMDDDDADWDHFSVSGASVDVVEYEDASVDIFGELTSGDMMFTKEKVRVGATSLGLELNNEEIISMDYQELKNRCTDVLSRLQIPRQDNNRTYPHGMPQRAVFCSRTLNLRSIQAIGYDMDYTLVHYDVNAWEGRAYDFAMRSLASIGCPTEGLTFDPNLVIRGLIMDTQLGNIVKVDRFGFVKRGMHGTRKMTPAEVRSAYGRELVNLRDESRWVFLNTLFSVSEAVMYAQMVDRLDDGLIPYTTCPQSYEALYGIVKQAIFNAHVEGKLKQEIMMNPSKYVRPDADLPQTLIDQRSSGKTLMLITNSDFEYTEVVMSYAFDPFLKDGETWKDLFDFIIVNARKPDFFKSDQSLYEVVTQDGLMRPARVLGKNGQKMYCGGSAKQVQQALGVSGDEILYIGDHIYTDAALAKLEFKWRTCLILRELEDEIQALATGRSHRQQLKGLLDKKERIGYMFNHIRLERQRILTQETQIDDNTYNRVQDMNRVLAELLVVMGNLDSKIGPAIQLDGADFNQRWGYLSKAGVNDRSQLQKQIEKYADIYTSRVSNFLEYSPFVYFRSPTQSMAHDRKTTDDIVMRNTNNEQG